MIVVERTFIQTFGHRKCPLEGLCVHDCLRAINMTHPSRVNPKRMDWMKVYLTVGIIGAMGAIAFAMLRNH